VAAWPVARAAPEDAARARRVAVRRAQEARRFAAARPVARAAPEDAVRVRRVVVALRRVAEEARARRAAPGPEVSAVLAPMRSSRARTPPNLM